LYQQIGPTKAINVSSLKQAPIYCVLMIALVLVSITTQAQDEMVQYTRPTSKIALPQLNAARTEIEELRAIEDVFGKEALYRGREYKRIDATYYVGHMFEGMAMYASAADELGYMLAAAPLQKAMDLLERDFDKYLRYRTSDVFTYFSIAKYQGDYDLIAGHLQECYQNSNQISQAIQIVRRLQQRNLQRETYCESYTTLAWIYHRNRFGTSKNDSELMSTIDSNEKHAQLLLDSALLKAQSDLKLGGVYGEFAFENSKHSIAHYRAILYTYTNNIDSGNKYYGILQQSNSANNNYASFLSVQGKFAEAYQYYSRASDEGAVDKRLQEHIYYRALLNNYNARPLAGAQLAQAAIDENGSTPGYGWYNLALARSYLYDGQIAKAQTHLAIAEEFQEVHIGTTLGKSHYDFTIALLKLISKEKQIAWIKFQDRRWWLSPKAIGSIVATTIEKYMIQYLLINQFSLNPERDLVIYKLFSTESTISYDEVWYLIKDFSTDFFIAKYSKQLKEDSRPLLKKYFSLYLAKLYLQKGDRKKAATELDKIAVAQDTSVYDKLFTARFLQAKAQATASATEAAQLHSRSMALYPQLTPFENVDIKASLRFSGPMGKTESEILKKLRKSKLNIVDAGSSNCELFLSFDTKDKLKVCTLRLADTDGKIISGFNTVDYTNADEGVQNILQATFNIAIHTPAKSN
jgi:hypothetical protein